MESPRIVIDANVLTPGLRSRNGASYRLLTLFGSNRFVPVLTVPLVIEYEKTLCDSRVGHPFSAHEIGRFLDYVCSVAEWRQVYFLWRPFLRDQKDDMVLEAAVNGECRFIITHNLAAFSGIDRFGVLGIKPRDFLVKIGELS